MSVTITMTDAQARTVLYLLSVHTEHYGIPRYSWTKRNKEQAERVVSALAVAMKSAEVTA